MSDTPIEAPTRRELYDETGLAFVRKTVEESHTGEYLTKVFRRECDNTYWQVCYFCSYDGYVNGLRGSKHCGPVEITHVYPVEVVTIKYTPVK